jgi:hypothetical protein
MVRGWSAAGLAQLVALLREDDQRSSLASAQRVDSQLVPCTGAEAPGVRNGGARLLRHRRRCVSTATIITRYCE